MPNSFAPDIRRVLPAYQAREGDDVYNAPYRATQVDLNAFILEADRESLNTLVQEQLGKLLECKALIGSQLGLGFECTEDWIVIIFAAFQSLSSVDKIDRGCGSVGAYELSVWVPITKRQDVGGVSIARPAWFLPLVYTAPTASVATGREVFGYPKVPAFLQVPPEGGPPQGVEVLDVVGVKAANVHAGSESLRRSVFSVDGTPVVAEQDWDAALLDQPLVRTVVGRYVGNAPVIFRKQVGISSADERQVPKAGYTAIIEAKVPISRLSSLVPIGPNECQGAVNVLYSEVSERLGVKSTNPLQGAAVRGCRLDIQPGNEIWVAAKPADYVAALPAPGNETMRGSGPAPRQAVERPDSGGFFSVTNADAEVYFADPKPSSISALLERHFPKDRWPNLRPEADPGRSFVAVSFLSGIVDDKVHLYEFSVSVPVKIGGEKAWYIPYIFRSPGAAVIHAREWFGHPCQAAFIDFDPASLEPRKVSFNVPLSFGPRAVSWVKDCGIQLERRASPEDYESAHGHLENFIGKQTIVSLLQTRHAADTSRACFQAIVKSTRALVVPDRKPIDGQLSLGPTVRLGRLMELDGKPSLPGFRLANVQLASSLPVVVS